MLRLSALEGRATPRLASSAAPSALPAAPTYARHVSQRTLLYALGAGALPGLDCASCGARPLAAEYVREEFEAFLRCGVLEHGFLRVVCEHCHADKFVWNEFEQP